ncbi:MAG: hypothetical protein QXZ70_00880 [Candidatus Bathyarchaeia archaeon]
MDRGPTLAISCLFGAAILFLLGHIASLGESELYMLWALLFGSFVAGALVWSFRCGIKRGRRLITVLCILFATISFVMSISVGFFLLLMNSLYLSAYFLLASIISWEVVSEIARRIP